MHKSKLYTRSGDKGSTSLVGGQRVSKTDVRIEAYGTVDELSSFIGIVLSDPTCPAEEKSHLLTVQSRLFDIGAYLATIPTADFPASLYGLNTQSVTDVETWIDTLDATTPAMHSFILPGGTPLAAHCHVARTVCRRAERRIYSLANATEVNPLITEYINRLSDYLFILARYLNHVAGRDDIAWKP